MHATVSIRPPPAGHPPKTYFAVSILKLILMSVCTFGLYEFYWFYKHWEEVKDQTRENLWPFWRAILSPLFCYSLFKRIKETSSVEGLRLRYDPGLAAFIYITLLAAGPYGLENVGLPLLTWVHPYVATIIPFLTFLPLVYVQREVIDLHHKVAPQADKNAGFSGLNITAIVIAGLFMTVSILFYTRTGDLRALAQAITMEYQTSEATSVSVDLESNVSADGVGNVILIVGFQNSEMGGLPEDERRDFARTVAEFVRDHYPGYPNLSTVAVGFAQITKRGPVTTTSGQGLYPFTASELGAPLSGQDSLQSK